MTTIEQAYINGFVKRAAEHGFTYNEAARILKTAAFEGTAFEGSPVHKLLFGGGGSSPAPAKPAASTPTPTSMGGMSGGIGGGLGQTANNPGAPKSSFIPGMAKEPAPAFTGGNMGGMSGGIGLGYGTIAKDPSQAANTPIGQMAAGGAPQPAPAPAPQPAAPAPAPQGPSDAFLAKVMGSYNPKSKVDQAQAQRIREMYQPGMTAKQIYADPRYKINREQLGMAPGANRSGYAGL